MHKLQKCRLKESIMEMKRAIQRSSMRNSRITISQMPSEFLRNNDLTLIQINNTIKFGRELYMITYVCALHMCYKLSSRYHTKYFLNLPGIKAF